MPEKELNLEKKLYLIRHGDYTSEGISRLDDYGHKTIKKLAMTIKLELEKVESYNISLFSSGYSRALESAMDIGEVLGLRDPVITVSHVMHGGNPKDSENFLELISHSFAKVGIVVGNEPLLDQFPFWFMNKYHPTINADNFYKKFINFYGAAVYINLKTGELIDLSRPREEQLAIPAQKVLEKSPQLAPCEPVKIISSRKNSNRNNMPWNESDNIPF